jgi:hypothetical protein
LDNCLIKGIKMTITYTWSVVQMDAYPQHDGETDVVFTVHWTLGGTNGTYSGSTYGSTGVTVNPAEPFTPYEDLTENQVLDWVWAAGVDKESQEANVATQIENQINPPVVTPPLPWQPSLN